MSLTRFKVAATKRVPVLRNQLVHRFSDSLRWVSFVWLICFASSEQVPAYTFTGNPPTVWPDGNIPIVLKLGSPGRTLIDGNTSWDTVAGQALDAWNSNINTIQFTTHTQSPGVGSNGDSINQAFFDSTVYGQSFGGALAVTFSWRIGTRRTEADVVFNTAHSWDSYRGNYRFSGGRGLPDLLRVALHEFGHALGLDHPDEAGQTVSAIMNSRASDLDHLTSDDVQGAFGLYGGVPPSITLQPKGQAVGVGSSATFSVMATGTAPLTYQWRREGFAIVGATSATFTISNVQAGQAGNYGVVISNTGGTVTSATAALIVTIPPTITAQPQSKTVAAGANVTFSVAGTGSAPMSFQWYRNNSPIAGATAASYSVSDVHPSDAGAYKVRVSNSAGTVESAVATLTMKADTEKPSVVISSPAAGARLTNSVVTLTGTARDNIQVMIVEYRLENSHGVGVYQPATGTSNWSATLTGLTPGVHKVRVRACDAAGIWSAEVTRSFNCVALASLTVATSGLGSVAPNLNSQRLEVGKTYTLTAVPAPGHVLSNWTGGLVSDSAKLSFVMQSNLTLQANFVANPFIARRGNYNGLFYETDETSGVRLNSSGFFAFALAERGTYSGYLQMNTGRRPFSGRFDLDGQATNVVRGAGLTNDLHLELTLDLSQTTTGRVTGHVVSANADWVAGLLGDRAPMYLGTNASPWQGRYALAIPGQTGSSEIPGGWGIGTLIVAKNGRLSWSGILGDGKPVTQNVPVSAAGYWPLFATPYGAKGSLLGWVSLDANQLQSFKTDLVGLMPAGNLAEASLALGGRLSWIKLSKPEKYYPKGFTNQPLVFGSAHVLKAPLLESGDWQVRFSGGNLTTDYVNNVFLTLNNKVTNAPLNQPPLMFQINPVNGLFSGSAKLPDNSLKGPLSFKGIVLQEFKLGVGQFFGTNQHGRVSLLPGSLSE